MRGSIRIYSENSTRKLHLNILRKEYLGWGDVIRFFYIEENAEFIYIESRTYSRRFGYLDYEVTGFVKLDLIKKRILKYSDFDNWWKDYRLLKYFGIEFLLHPLINNKTLKISVRTYNSSIDNMNNDYFYSALFGDVTNPTDILKSKLESLKFNIKTFPLREFKKIMLMETNIWQNKVSRYYDFFYYMRWSNNIKTLFENIHKLKKIDVVELFEYSDILHKKVNMSWSINRMKQELMIWKIKAREQFILAKNNEYISDDIIFPELKYCEPLKSKHAITFEGREMNNCVGTNEYWERCKTGNSLIYSYNNKFEKIRATLEITLDKFGNLSINQFRKKHNKGFVPKKLKEEIILYLDNYNQKIKK